jgi:hypothetical protein
MITFTDQTLLEASCKNLKTVFENHWKINYNNLLITSTLIAISTVFENTNKRTKSNKNNNNNK